MISDDEVMNPGTPVSDDRIKTDNGGQSASSKSASSKSASSKSASSKSALSKSILSWVATIGVALVFVVIVNTFLVRVYSIPSTSMVPTLLVGDRVVVSKLSKNPGRGDIIVFDRPINDPAGPNDPAVLIKRVIGLPGETVESRDGKVYVSGKLLQEDYLPDNTFTQIDSPIIVPKGHLLVLGDNRKVSQDGRFFGPIDKKLIVGRAVLRIWPLSRAGSL